MMAASDKETSTPFAPAGISLTPNNEGILLMEVAEGEGRLGASQRWAWLRMPTL